MRSHLSLILFIMYLETKHEYEYIRRLSYQIITCSLSVYFSKRHARSSAVEMASMTRDHVSVIVDGRVRNAMFPSASASTPSVVVTARAQRARVFVLWATKERIALRVSVCVCVCSFLLTLFHCQGLKVIVHTKMKILSSFTHAQVVPNLHELFFSIWVSVLKWETHILAYFKRSSLAVSPNSLVGPNRLQQKHFSDMSKGWEILI